MGPSWPWSLVDSENRSMLDGSGTAARRGPRFPGRRRLPAGADGGARTLHFEDTAIFQAGNSWETCWGLVCLRTSKPDSSAKKRMPPMNNTPRSVGNLAIPVPSRDSLRFAGGASSSRRSMARAAFAALVCAVLTSGVALADSPAAPAAAPAAAAPAAPAPTNAELAARLADVEAYVTNGQPKTLTTVGGPGHNAWMMTSAALVLVHDPARVGAVLRRPGSAQERPVGHGSVSRLRRPGHLPLVAVRLQPGVRQGRRLRGGARQHFVRILERRHERAQRRLRLLGVAERLLDVPADVRDHHAGADRRRHRRAHEVLGAHGLHSALDVRRLLPARPHGVGRRRHDERRLECQGCHQVHRLRRRYRRPHVLGMVGAHALPHPR